MRVAVLVMGMLCLGVAGAVVPVIPYPERVEIVTKGKTLLNREAVRIFAGENVNRETVARELSKVFSACSWVGSPKEAAIRIEATLPGASEEAYRLTVEQGTITIAGSGGAGVFYALQTLRQLAGNENGAVSFPRVKIEDAPAFTLRGFMHDTGRNFQTIESLKRQLDIFAFYKLNTFHWHLTDYPAWRPQSKIYPELNSGKGRQEGRDPDKSYTFDEIREVFAYAKARHIRIIPELDMPGHSAYFKPVFGFEMGTPEGIEVLKKLIREFCEEISQVDAPILHIGSDEIHIRDPQGFMREIERAVRECGRVPMIWAPGLKPTGSDTIRQLWRDGENPASFLAGLPNPIIDSTGGYLNLYDPQQIVLRHFHHSICGVERGDGKTSLGGLLCCWPDARVDDKSKIFSHNAVWPGLCAFTERAWRGGKIALQARYEIPLADDYAFAQFERRLMNHRERFFEDMTFDYIPMSRHTWRLLRQPLTLAKDAPFDTPFPLESHSNDRNFFAGNDFRTVRGSSFLFAARKIKGIYPSKAGSVTYLWSTFTLESPRKVYFRIGFDSPARSNRYAGGIPPQGKLDSNGGTVLLNGQPLPAPVYQNPGKFRFAKNTWHDPANEIPFIDEEFFWLREPVAVDLPAGTHTLLIRCVQAMPEQAWAATCLPVVKHNGRWIDDESIVFDVR